MPRILRVWSDTGIARPFLPVVTHLDPLDAATLRSILTEPKNSLIKQYSRLFAYEGIELTIEPVVPRFYGSEGIGIQTWSKRF